MDGWNVEKGSLVSQHGRLTMYAFRTPANREHLAVVAENIAPSDIDLLRVQSACITSTVLGSLACDCAAQIQYAMVHVVAPKHGAFIYLDEEGRGHGLAEKVAQFREQNAGADTVDAALRRHVPVDLRDYGDAASIMNILFPDRRLSLLTNNPDKYEKIAALVPLAGRLPIECAYTKENLAYLRAKRDKLGHLLLLADSS